MYRFIWYILILIEEDNKILYNYYDILLVVININKYLKIVVCKFMNIIIIVEYNFIYDVFNDKNID